MAETLRGVQIDLGGRPRHLKFNHNAIAVLESVAGQTVSQIFTTIGTSMGFDLIRKMLYVALIHEDFQLRKKSHEEGLWLVGELIESAVGDTAMERVAYVQGKITEALTAAFGDPAKNAGSPAPTGGAAANGIGTTPSESPSVSAV